MANVKLSEVAAIAISYEAFADVRSKARRVALLAALDAITHSSSWAGSLAAMERNVIDSISHPGNQWLRMRAREWHEMAHAVRPKRRRKTAKEAR